jgi:hypothetical protein
MDYNPLKQRHHGERKNYPHNLSLRVHRALSGLHLACPDENDLDGQFILLWPAFNAAYEQYVVYLNVIEAVAFSRFVTKISDVDHNQYLIKLVWIVYPSSIRL